MRTQTEEGKDKDVKTPICNAGASFGSNFKHTTKTLCAKEAINKVERQPTEREKYLPTVHPISNHNNPVKKGTKDMERDFSKEHMANTWKNAQDY